MSVSPESVTTFKYLSPVLLTQPDSGDRENGQKACLDCRQFDRTCGVRRKPIRGCGGCQPKRVRSPATDPSLDRTESNSFGKDFTSYNPTSGDWSGETVPRDVNQVFATSVEAERGGQRSI